MHGWALPFTVSDDTIAPAGGRSIMLPRLTGLQLSIHGDAEYREALAQMHMPKLQYLSLSDFGRPVTDYLGALTSSLGELRWLQVKAVIFEEAPFLESLASMPSLESLALDGKQGSPVVNVLIGLAKPRNDGGYLLPRLKHLDLTGMTDPMLGKVCLQLVRRRKRDARQGNIPLAGSSRTPSGPPPVPLVSLIVDTCLDNGEDILTLMREVPKFTARGPGDIPSPRPAVDMYGALDVLDAQTHAGPLSEAKLV